MKSWQVSPLGDNHTWSEFRYLQTWMRLSSVSQTICYFCQRRAASWCLMMMIWHLLVVDQWIFYSHFSPELGLDFVVDICSKKYEVAAVVHWCWADTVNCPAGSENDVFICISQDYEMKQNSHSFTFYCSKPTNYKLNCIKLGIGSVSNV